jgi:hypothetical protein
MREMVSFGAGLMLGLGILFFSLKAERDTVMIVNLKSKVIILSKKTQDLEQTVYTMQAENDNLKYGLNQCRILYRGL